MLYADLNDVQRPTHTLNNDLYSLSKDEDGIRSVENELYALPTEHDASHVVTNQLYSDVDLIDHVPQQRKEDR